MEHRWRRRLGTSATHRALLGLARAGADVQRPSAGGRAGRLNIGRLGILRGIASLPTGSAQCDTAAPVPAAQVVGPGYQMAPVTTRHSDRHRPRNATSHGVGEFTARLWAAIGSKPADSPSLAAASRWAK
jgi:hypothetical protein